MAGNGWELTRDLLAPGPGGAVTRGEWGPGTLLPANALVVLRGRPWQFARPLLYRDLEEQQADAGSMTQAADAASPFTGVRVLLEVPEP